MYKIIKIKIVANSKKLEFKKLSEDFYLAYLTQPPLKNKANKQLLELVSDYFNISKIQSKYY
jgi:uncharacterized protein YggU (UPF0235/DUF167 family)